MVSSMKSSAATIYGLFLFHNDILTDDCTWLSQGSQQAVTRALSKLVNSNFEQIIGI